MPAVPNRLTRVPDTPVPKLPAAVRPVVLIADLFMFLMASRPATGSLQNTWVTPATFQLCATVAVLGVPIGLALLFTRATRVTIALGLALVVIAVGAAAVAVVGAMQRSRMRLPEERLSEQEEERQHR